VGCEREEEECRCVRELSSAGEECDESRSVWRRKSKKSKESKKGKAEECKRSARKADGGSSREVLSRSCVSEESMMQRVALRAVSMALD
jgi:hypothetical protein